CFMQHAFDNQLREVRAYFDSADYSLGLRRLTDCAIETGKPEIFREVLSYYEWLEHFKQDQVPEEERTLRAFALLELIGNSGLVERKDSDLPVLEMKGV